MLEEKVFLYATGGSEPRILSLAKCRVQAGQFRDAVETRQAQTTQSPESGRCPFELHALLRIPTSTLRLGIRNLQAQASLRKDGV